MLFQVVPRIAEQAGLTLHPTTAGRLGCARQKIGFLRFGERSAPVEIRVSAEVGEQELWLGLATVERLGLPLFCRYELRRAHNELQIGPLIGIAMVKTHETLRTVVGRLTSYVYEYASIGGAVLAFALDGVDPAKRQIRGFWYNPETNAWEEGRAGYPGALFKRVGMPEELRAHLQEALGCRVFNETIFDKWEMHEWLSGIPEAARFLPETRRYRGADDVWPLLDRHGQVFLKPIRGSQGQGVVRLSLGDGAVVAEFAQDGVQQRVEWPEREQAARFLASRIGRGRYVAQQGLELVQRAGQVIDFRLIVVKNRFGRWEQMGAVARTGPAGSIVSNISQGGTAEMAEVTLGSLDGWGREEARRQVEAMTDAAVTAARCLEEAGVHGGNLGVDLALDAAGNVWILEINNLDPNHTILLDAGNRRQFCQVRLENMLYAKKLAGFGEEPKGGV